MSLSGAAASRGPHDDYLPQWKVSPKLSARGLGESRLALGLGGLGGAWGPVDQGESLETLRHALHVGVTVFDTAPAYGTGEKLLGRALAEWRGPKPIISTKVGRLPAGDALDMKCDYHPSAMRDSLRRSLDVLGVECVDILLLHEPEMVPHADRERAFAALKQFQAEGLTRRLGLGGGFGAAWDGLLVPGAIDVVMNYARFNAATLIGRIEDQPRIRAAGALFYAASPLVMGLLGSRHDTFMRERPDWIPADLYRRAAALSDLAKRRGLTLPDLAHRFLFALAGADRVVIGAANLSEFKTAWTAWTAGPLPPEIFAEAWAVAAK